MGYDCFTCAMCKEAYMEFDGGGELNCKCCESNWICDHCIPRDSLWKDQDLIDKVDEYTVFEYEDFCPLCKKEADDEKLIDEAQKREILKREQFIEYIQELKLSKKKAARLIHLFDA
jgi:hypothetical protein